jgi:hypothetical protein
LGFSLLKPITQLGKEVSCTYEQGLKQPFQTLKHYGFVVENNFLAVRTLNTTFIKK